MKIYIAGKITGDQGCQAKFQRAAVGLRMCGNIVLNDKNLVPAADVAEVVHGRWILHDDGVFTCSECGNAESNDSYYCRLCGAKMDGGVRT